MVVLADKMATPVFFPFLGRFKIEFFFFFFVSIISLSNYSVVILVWDIDTFDMHIIAGSAQD